MIRIEISPLDQKDLLEILDFAATWYELTRGGKNKRDKWDNTNWYLMRIEQLQEIIKGRIVQDSLIKSSLGTFEDADLYSGKDEFKDNSISM